ncbi:type VI secretion system protein [Sphingomonas sp.]|uniref:type VI secretion system protein n=1 Tax=Sphingomonas sp. TaxID=28214 RepID=UPI0028AFF51A|nr:type VI secretion system protein [Sphingomonas sp.]
MSWWGILLLLVLAVAVIALLLFLAYRAGWIDRVRAGRLRPARGEEEIAPPANLGTAVQIALAELRSRTGAAADLRDVPWALVLGAEMPALDALMPPDPPPEHRVSWLARSGVERAGLISFRERGVVVGFNDGLVGEPDCNRRLLDLLQRLEQARPGRPIDSLVLAVPAALLQGDPADPGVRQRVEAHGQALYDLVLAAQSRTGWRVPIYLLITGSEAIEGFDETASAVLRHSRSPMIGWASPQPLDSSFEPARIDEGFAELIRHLLAVQCHLMMALHDQGRAEQALRFPDRVAALRPLVTMLLLRLLKESAYHEGFLLRGLFFTGAMSDGQSRPLALGGPDGDAAATSETPPPAATMPQPLAAALFQDKIFPEHGLAQPAYGERTRRHRLVRRTQWTLAASIVAFLIGITALSIRSQERFAPVHAVLVRIANIQTPDTAHGTDCTAPAGVTTAASDLLRRLADIHVDRLETFLAPTSFLVSATKHARTAIAASFHRVVFAALVERMATPHGIAGRLAIGLPTSDHDPAYWPSFMANVRAFDTHFAMLTDVDRATQATPAVVRQFGEVADYALGEKLPDLVGNDQLYAAAIALQSNTCLNRERVGKIVMEQVRAAYAATVHSWYEADPVVQRVLAIDTEFGSEAALLPTVDQERRLAATASLERLQKLSQLLDNLAAALPGANHARWTGDPSNLALPDLNGLTGTTLIQPSILQSMPESYRPRATDLVARVRGARLAGTPLLQFGASMDSAAAAPPPAAAAGVTPLATAPVSTAAVALDGGPRLSQAAGDSQTMLHDVFGQPFIQRGDALALPTPSGLWDVQRLQQFEQLAKKYLSFADTAPATIPQPLVRATGAAVRTRAGRYIALETINSTVKASGTDEQRASNFVLALPTLQSIRLLLREFGELDGAMRIGSDINVRAAEVIADAERDLDRDGGPYAVDRRGVATWDGRGSLAANAFATGTIDNLKATLAGRRAWVTQIARGRVAPVVTYAREPTNSVPPLLVARAERWAAILRALEGYDAGPNPNNPVTRLEQFMTVDIDRLQAQGCTGIGRVAARGGDYFANQQLRISAEIFGRCRSTVLADLRNRYAQLRESFQATIAGRFPFGPADAPDADPALVRAFFRRFGAEIGPMQAALEDVEIGRDAAVGLGRLLAAQSALAPMLAGADLAQLRYAVDVQFFSDPHLASGQNQIIEAMIGTPTSRAATNAAPTFLWRVGDPVIARFRWANNAPNLPLSGLALPDGPCRPAPDGAWGSSRTGGAWALLRLLRQQGLALEESAAASGYPVVFGFDLCANLDHAVGGDAPTTRASLVVRLTLSAASTTPDKPPVPIALPGFPAALPVLDTLGRR